MGHPELKTHENTGWGDVMDLELTGKRVVITGASKGIGKAVAEAMAKEGCDLYLVARSHDVLSEVSQDLIARYGVNVQIHAADLSNSDVIRKVLARAGTPDILINNAGAIPAGTLDAVDEARWRAAWDLKVFGYINMCRAFYDAMKEQGDGVIINVTGLAGEKFDAGYIAGTTGNAGLNAFTRALGGRSLRDGIRVLSVSPGAVETERLVNLMRTKAEADFGDPEKWRDYLKNLPLSRAASVEECADVITFMASKRANYMSGTIVTIDGGHGASSGSFT